jgi:tRNA(Ile)-lysidine synthase
VLPQVLLPGKPVRGGGREVGTAIAEPSVAIELERLRGLDAATRRRVVRAAARQLGVRANFADTARLLEMAASNSAGKSGAKLHLSGGLRAERGLRELRLTRLSKGSSD